MRAAVDDVHHRDGHYVCVGAADIAVERYMQIVGSCMSHCEGYAEDGVGAEVGLGLGAVQSQHLVVDGTLLEH